jgi:hypothetical protein
MLLCHYVSEVRFFAFDIILIYVVALKQFEIALPNFKTDIEIIKKNMKNGTVIPEKRE